MSEPIRTALFGGTFDPIHNGHLAIARSVLDNDQADEVWLLITPCNPWKKDKELLDDNLRLEMALAAVQDLQGVRVSDYEMHLPIPSYTADTLRHISVDYPDRRFILMIGADNWVKFKNWRDSDYILDNFPITVYPRQDCPIGHLPSGVTLLDMPLINISSTQIRQMVKDGTPINEFVPASVARTIEEKRLYLKK